MLVLTVVLGVGLLVALVAPPPSASRPSATVLLALAAVATYVAALVIGLRYDSAAGTLMVGPGIGMFCLSTWFSRASDPRGDDGGGGGGGDEPQPDSPFDWDEFDRLRTVWGRTREPIA